MKQFLLPLLLAAALPAADSRVTTAMNAFTTTSYKQLARGDGNLILSPLNVAAALSMALAGAGGQTAEEIQSVLHVHYDSGYSAAVGALLTDLTTAGNSGGNELHAANGLNTPPANILFLDDRNENIEAALAIGMQAILYTTHHAFEQEMRARSLDHLLQLEGNPVSQNGKI